MGYPLQRTKEGCILWLGGLNKSGYGQIRDGKKVTTTHRLVYELFKGPIPEGMCVCHKCDIRNCINLDHLFLGTTQENTQDRVNKGRSNGGRRSKITPELSKFINEDPRSGSQLAKDLKIPQSIISRVRNGWIPQVR